VDEWTLAQAPGEKLARLQYYAVTKKIEGKDVEYRITVHEYPDTIDDRSMRFRAQADLVTDAGTAGYRPSGWGPTLVKALQECIREIDRFPPKL